MVRRSLRQTLVRSIALLSAIVIAGTAVVSGIDQKFYDDDPIVKEPSSEDASKVKPWSVILSFDLLQNLFAKPGDHTSRRAMNVNSIDEVPDSDWFTNRILARPLSIEEAVRGPRNGSGPAPGPMTLVAPKRAGVSPGFRLRDSAGVQWFVQFDGNGYPEAATAASMVANNIFHALGYWQLEYHLVTIHPEAIAGTERTATVRTPSRRIRPYDQADIDAVFDRAAAQPDGSYRMLASRAVAGTPVGSFKYNGTRPDDPNDVVPHEHRRELRALQVFGAWTNLVDMKAGNTLDVLMASNGKSFVRHYMQDVGSTFGTGALGPRDWDEGYEHLFDSSLLWKRLATFGFFLQPWQTISYTENKSIGRFEGDRFDPAAWKPRVPTAAILNARADDLFWAARRVMAFSDDMIRAIVKVGAYSDEAAEKHLADVLIKRRDAIGRAYLPAVNPIVDPALGPNGILTFGNAAVDAGVASAPSLYRAKWAVFNNVTHESSPLGETSGATPRLESARGLPVAVGSYVRVEISADATGHPAWAVPITTYFRRTADGWKLVGLERLE